MTEIYGIRLAYRGLIAGLVGAYCWLAIAMLAAVAAGHPLGPLQLLAAVGPDGWNASPGEAFATGLGVLQVAGGGIGMVFAYFFGRFFTVRRTLALASPCVAVLAWWLLAGPLGSAAEVDPWRLGASAAMIFAALAYGLVLGTSLPLRGEVLRPAQAG